MTTVKKQLNSASKLYLNSKDLQIPTISITSKYLELKPVEQLNFRSVSHGDLMIRKSIIKHLLKRFVSVAGPTVAQLEVFFSSDYL